MIELAVFLQPRASRERILGWHQGELKVAVTAPPVDGEANARLIALLSKTLGVAKSRITLQSGQSNRHKKLQIDADAETVFSRLPPGLR